MENEKKSKIMIMRLQDNLNTFRKICGWTTQELGDKIGVTKQTISNLENKRSVMTKLQYIGLRSIFQDETEKSSEDYTKLLKLAMDKLLDAEMTEEEMEEYESKMWYAATAIYDGADVTKASERLGFKEDLLSGNQNVPTNNHGNRSEGVYVVNNSSVGGDLGSAIMEAGKVVGAAATIPLGISAGIIGSTIGTFWGMRERGWLSGLNDED